MPSSNENSEVGLKTRQAVEDELPACESSIAEIRGFDQVGLRAAIGQSCRIIPDTGQDPWVHL